MWPIWFRNEISSGKDFEILWKFVIFQIFISSVLSNLHSTDDIPHCTDVIPHCTEGISPLYWIPSTVLMLSPTVLMLSSTCTDVTPQCTEYPPQYWSYPPLYWCYPPTVLNNLYSTEGIPTVLKLSPTCTEAIPHMYCCYSRHSTEGIPPQYWIPSTVLMLSPTVLMLSSLMYWCYPPTVLNNLHSTEVIPHSAEAIPHSTDVIPPMYWTTSNVLNNLHSTEPTLYGVIMVQVVESQAEYDYGTCVLSQVPQAEFNLVCGTAGTVQSEKNNLMNLSWTGVLRSLLSKWLHESNKETFLSIFSSCWLSNIRPKKKLSRTQTQILD